MKITIIDNGATTITTTPMRADGTLRDGAVPMKDAWPLPLIMRKNGKTKYAIDRRVRSDLNEILRAMICDQVRQQIDNDPRRGYPAYYQNYLDGLY